MRQRSQIKNCSWCNIEEPLKTLYTAVWCLRNLWKHFWDRRESEVLTCVRSSMCLQAFETIKLGRTELAKICFTWYAGLHVISQAIGLKPKFNLFKQAIQSGVKLFCFWEHCWKYDVVEVLQMLAPCYVTSLIMMSS